MTKEEIAELTKDIGNIAANILLQLDECKIKTTIVDEFYLGILVRGRIILNDVSKILKNNSEMQITSAFVLLRVLLDDFIRLFGVHVKTNQMEEEVYTILADAYSHRFKNMEESAEINTNYFEGKHQSLFNEELIKQNKEIFLRNEKFDKLFENKSTFKFKKLKPISKVFENLKKDNINLKDEIHSYVVYKSLSQYIHYSNLTYDLEINKNTRKVEIEQIKEILNYIFKMLEMQFSYFKQNYNKLKWKDDKMVYKYFSN
jgi:hypothetical protein